MKLRNVALSMLVLAIVVSLAVSNLLAAAGPSTLADFEGAVPAGWFNFFGGTGKVL